MDAILYCDEYERSSGAREAIPILSQRPANASYRYIDGIELATAKAAPHAMGPSERELVEKHLRWQHWYMGGRNTFVIGPDTTARIMARVKAGDVPTAPVPTAYFEFEQPPVNYAASKPLRAAFLYRGVVGRITFMPDPPRTEKEAADMSLTVYLPSIFRNRDLDHLRKGMSATRGAGHASKEAQSLARTMASNMHSDLDDAAIMASAMHLESLGRIARGETGDACMHISATLFDAVYGAIEQRPNALLPKAARIVLVAADEARAFDERYGAPSYVDIDAVSRNWMEIADEPIERRTDVVRMP